MLACPYANNIWIKLKQSISFQRLSLTIYLVYLENERIRETVRAVWDQITLVICGVYGGKVIDFSMLEQVTGSCSHL